MELEAVMGWIQICGVAAAAGGFLTVLSVALYWKPGDFFLEAFEGLYQTWRQSENGILDYRRLQDYLLRNGAEIHFGRWLSPTGFVAGKLLLGALGLLLGSRVMMSIGFLSMLICFWLPDACLMWMNRRDNERMLPELKLVYNAISLQIKAGVYVTDALSECYGSVQDKRLRTALLTLSGSIVMKADVEEALEDFQKSFDNRYVDALCVTILQALESGQAVDLLSDIAEQIKDMETELLGRKKSNLDRSLTFYQLGILSALLVAVLYACITYMMQTAVNF